MQKSVIIVAGGSGTRMNANIPKQFLEISGKPIVIHTIEKFYSFDNSISIILALPEQHIPLWHKLVKKHNFNIPLQLVNGGETRFDSVKNGLKMIENGIVAIHDAVRPLVSLDTIKRAFETAILKGNAIPSILINDSIRILDNSENKSLDRTNIRIIQTPQCFNATLIKKAYNQDFDVSFTDDASVLEKTGEKINLTEGNQENIKITNPTDIIIANALYGKLSYNKPPAK
ncbi:MAG: 2-C-methyl-D-erythritol 4-phosphate cytidylyltransferase [Bacteroidetes bacterium]|nr:2-C-methyl-D-erythritol 4-phosphate cytidylyltransferase [Bacteroidota bacterium]